MTWACAALGLGIATSSFAQWLDYRTLGLPRTSDGKPDLKAPAPRTAAGRPDLSGLWHLAAGPGYLANVTGELSSQDIQPWAEALYKQRLGDLGSTDPWTTQCLPLGPRQLLIGGGGGGGPARILQTSTEIAVLYEDLTYRQIFMDGRALPQDPNPSWMGYSVGRWDGDTLVVESNGFNDRSWLDLGGHPHTEALHLTERYHRTSLGHMDVQVTYDDPKAYNKPWTISFGVNLEPDTSMLEYVCAENERDQKHLVGRTAQEKQVTVPREVLATYVGTYKTVANSGSGMSSQQFVVTLDGDQLMIHLDGHGSLPLIPLSQTKFSPRLLGTYEFFKNDRGAVDRMMAYSTEGDLTAVRVPAAR